MNSSFKKAQNIFLWAKKEIPNNCELEIYLSQGRSRSVIWSEEKLEELSQAEGGGGGIRVIFLSKKEPEFLSGQQGYAYTTADSKESIEKTTQRALEIAKSLPPDRFRRLPDITEGTSREEPSLDTTIFSCNISNLKDRLKHGEAYLLKQVPFLKSILRAGFSEGLSDVAIINSNGIERAFSGTYSGLGVSCLAEKEGERQEGGFGQTKIFQKDLDWDFIFKRAAERTLALLGGRPIPSGKIPVIFDPSVAVEFLSLISSAVLADSLQTGKSFFLNKMGENVASKMVKLVDDGTLTHGLATAPYDDEGFPTQRTVVVEDGTLKHFLYDTYTALKDGTRSTGNASRAGFKSSPSSGTSNFYLEPGPSLREAALKETKGLYLYDVMGLHMADPISGDFSVGAIGAWLENGEFKYGVRGITLAGNLIHLLKNIDRVCEDLTFFGSTGSPTFRVQEMVISGA